MERKTEMLTARLSAKVQVPKESARERAVTFGIWSFGVWRFFLGIKVERGLRMSRVFLDIILYSTRLLIIEMNRANSTREFALYVTSHAASGGAAGGLIRGL